ncbi:MAG: ABC-2 family transporter protein [Anaerolineales bacterium]|nr:ABC-2 family transporter protein [Anaerolineales bacterium]
MRKYFAIFRATLSNSLAYPGELFGRALLILPFMWIFYQLWRVTFTAAGVEELNGLTLGMTLWYLMLAETIEISRPRLGKTISDAIKDGSVAYILGKPYDFLLYHYSNSLGETVFRAVLNALLGGALVWLLVGPPPDLLGWPLVLLAVLGAWTLNFCVTAMIGLLAFVVEDVSAFEWIYQKLAFILGGLLIPLDFYPAWLQSLAKALPFSAMIYAPARLFVAPSLPALAATLGLQLAWIGGLALLLLIFYRRSLAYLSVNGG